MAYHTIMMIDSLLQNRCDLHLILQPGIVKVAINFFDVIKA